jgi:cell division protein FtsB
MHWIKKMKEENEELKRTISLLKESNKMYWNAYLSARNRSIVLFILFILVTLLSLFL